MQKLNNNSGLKGVILCGGFSSRMKRDKSLLLYDEIPFYIAVKLSLQAYCSEVFISCRSDQAQNYPGENIITDQMRDIGPASGVLAAMTTLPGSALLVIACDMPGIQPSLLTSLVVSWVDAENGVFFKDLHTGHIEPLLGIYPPTFRDTISDEVRNGNTGLQHILRSIPNLITIPLDTRILPNYNTARDLRI